MLSGDAHYVADFVLDYDLGQTLEKEWSARGGGSAFYAPVLLFRMIKSAKYRDGLWEKFWGKAPTRIGERPCLWFHAVSVGEVRLLRPLVHEMALLPLP